MHPRQQGLQDRIAFLELVPGSAVKGSCLFVVDLQLFGQLPVVWGKFDFGCRRIEQGHDPHI